MSGEWVTLVGFGCLLLAALAYWRGWRFAFSIGLAGTAILAGILAGHGLRSGHWPFFNQRAFALAFALGVAVAAFALGTRPTARVPAVQASAMVMAAALVLYGLLGAPAGDWALEPQSPALVSAWLPLHVGIAALAYGALAVAGAAGMVWLVCVSSRVETARLLERAVAVGYPLLTLALLLGIVWAQTAWGRYWTWDAKEVWSLVTWLVFTLFWHLRHRPGWPGRRLAWLALVGTALMLFTFVGVGWLARTVSV